MPATKNKPSKKPIVDEKPIPKTKLPKKTAVDEKPVIKNKLSKKTADQTKKQGDNLPYEFKRLNIEDIATNGGKLRSTVKNEDSPTSEFPASITERGVLQPIIVKKGENGDGKYILVDGERRWEAARIAGEKKIMALIASPKMNTLETAIILNMQREELEPIEAAVALQKLIESYEEKGKKLTHEDLAKIMGWKRSSVSELLALNRLPDCIKGSLQTSKCKIPKSRLLDIAKEETEEAMIERWKEALEIYRNNEKAKNGKNGLREKREHQEPVYEDPVEYPSPDGNFIMLIKKKKGETIELEPLTIVFNDIVRICFPGQKISVRLEQVAEANDDERKAYFV